MTRLARGGKCGCRPSPEGSVCDASSPADCKAPVAGTVTEINEAIVAEPGLVNEDAMGNGWFFKLKVDEPDAVESLMDAEAYEASIA